MKREFTEATIVIVQSFGFCQPAAQRALFSKSIIASTCFAGGLVAQVKRRIPLSPSDVHKAACQKLRFRTLLEIVAKFGGN